MTDEGRRQTGDIGPDLLGHYGELVALTACRCDPAWTERRLHSPDCHQEYREDVLALGLALGFPAPSDDASSQQNT